MAIDNSLSLTFWTIYHSLLRDENGDEAEKTRARNACTWMTLELPAIQRSCTPEECDVIGDIYDSWQDLKHAEAPSYALVKQRVQMASDPAKEERLKEYDDLAPDLPRLHVEDLGAHLHVKGTEYREAKISLALRNSLKILHDGAEIKDPSTHQKVKVKGADDAIKHFVSRMDAGFGSISSTPTHGSVDAMMDRVVEVYEDSLNPIGNRGKVIPTGITGLDKWAKIRKGHFAGILGFAGHGKTRLGRRWVYSAAEAGFHVLHVSYEQTFDEELVRYAIIHAHNVNVWGPVEDKYLPTIEAYDDSALTALQRNFLEKEVKKDLEQGNSLKGKISIRQPEAGGDWEMLKVFASITNRTCPLDMLFIDYLTQVPTKSLRHQREEMELVIQDAKTLAMTFNDNEGLLVATPVQANRAGWEAAKKAKGRYEMDAVWMYSQFDKALDICLSVYGDDDLDAESKVVLGSCKHRRGKNIFPFKVGVRHSCGTFHDLDTSPEVVEQTIDEAMEYM